jgi:hypothetical protein
MFKKGDKVICVSQISDLELNKIYTISNVMTYQDSISVEETKNNHDSDFYYFNFRFKDIKEIRKQKLEKICSKSVIE